MLCLLPLLFLPFLFVLAFTPFGYYHPGYYHTYEPGVRTYYLSAQPPPDHRAPLPPAAAPERK